MAMARLCIRSKVATLPRAQRRIRMPVVAMVRAHMPMMAVRVPSGREASLVGVWAGGVLPVTRPVRARASVLLLGHPPQVVPHFGSRVPVAKAVRARLMVRVMRPA